MGTSKKAMYAGEPLGKKRLKKFIPCLRNPRKIVPKNIEQENKNVISTWLVKA